MAINYLPSNSYFILGSMRYRKFTGIPMGSDLPLSMAKLFLYYYKMKWILHNPFTFKDDLCTFSNDDFENNYNDIYPYLLNPEKVNKDLCKSSFFYFSIEVYY